MNCANFEGALRAGRLRRRHELALPMGSLLLGRLVRGLWGKFERIAEHANTALGFVEGQAMYRVYNTGFQTAIGEI